MNRPSSASTIAWQPSPVEARVLCGTAISGCAPEESVPVARALACVRSARANTFYCSIPRKFDSEALAQGFRPLASKDGRCSIFRHDSLYGLEMCSAAHQKHLVRKTVVVDRETHFGILCESF